jgi:hypothetical protein
MRPAISIAIILVLYSLQVDAQLDSSMVKAKRPRLFDATLDFYTTLSWHTAKNAPDPMLRKNFYFYYNTTFQNRIQIKKVRISTYFFNEFGLRRYADSVMAVTEDMFTLKNSISYSLGKSRLSLNIGATTRSQFWKHYTYKGSMGQQLQRFLFTDYLSPGYTLYAGGIRVSFWSRSSVDFGLAGARTTIIRNQQIFADRKANRLYGLESGDKKTTTIGFNIVVNIASQKLFKNMYWEHFSQGFISKDSLRVPESCTIDLNNAFHYLFLKYVRVSVRTHLVYDRAVQRYPTWMQQFSVGFYLNNKM